MTMLDISGLSDQQIADAIHQLGDLLKKLTLANQALLTSTDRFADLPGLLDQRDLTLTIMRETETSLANTLGHSPSSPPPTLATILQLARQSGRITAQAWDAFSVILKEFHATNQEIEQVLQNEKSRLSASLKTVRKGSALLKGYAPPGTSGSCFIDKIK